MLPRVCYVTSYPCWVQAMHDLQAAKGKKALQPSNSANVQRAKAIEDIYQKKSQLEHILLRPDTYIGSTEKKEDKLWVHDGEQLVQQDITYAPGLYKIFDEILVNAADNKVRDPKMDTLKVDISAVSLMVDMCLSSGIEATAKSEACVSTCWHQQLCDPPGGEPDLRVEQW